MRFLAPEPRSDTKALRQRFDAAQPFRWLLIDGFLRPDTAQALAVEIDGTIADASEVLTPKDNPNAGNKLGIRRPEHLGPLVTQFFEDLASAELLGWLSQITGIAPLEADPELSGGGIHAIGPGGFLNVHADFNVHPKTGRHRRLNLLLYMNPAWNIEWGGCLELWPADLSARAHVIAPTFNRMVLFETSETSFHGHPEPLRAPPGIVRKSLAAYFYSDWPAGLSPRTRTDYRLVPP